MKALFITLGILLAVMLMFIAICSVIAGARSDGTERTNNGDKDK